MRHRNLLLFLLLAALWGTAFMAIKAGLQYFPPVLFAALRYDLAAVLMLAYAAVAVERWRPRSAAEWRVVAVGGAFMIAGYHAFLFVGEQETTSAAAAVVVATVPVLTTGMAGGLLPDDRLGPVGAAGVLLGLAGVGLVAQPDPAALLAGDVAGEVLVFAAAAAFAAGSVLVRRSPADLPIETMEAWSMLVGAGLMHLVSAGLPAESPAAVRWTAEGVGALAYLVVAASAVGFLVYFDLHERLGPVEINLVSYVVPVFAALAGWLWLDEVVDATTVGGFLVIFAGFCLVKRRALARELPRLRAALAR